MDFMQQTHFFLQKSEGKRNGSVRSTSNKKVQKAKNVRGEAKDKKPVRITNLSQLRSYINV
jgi:hypothetical protein